MSKNVVLIDIDGTLFNCNSTFDFLDSLPHGKWYRVYRKISSSILGRIINKVSILLIQKDIVRIVGVMTLKGFKRNRLYELGEEFYNRFLLPRKISTVFDLLAEEQKKGSCIILASATLDFLAEIIQRRLNADGCTSTALSYKNGYCQGIISQDRLGRKMDALKEMEVILPVELVVTDNITDESLLRNSRRQVVVVYPREERKWECILKKNKFENLKVLRHE